MEHRHTANKKRGFGREEEDICHCGVTLCQSISCKGGGVGCTLEKGHRGPHLNTWYPEVGTWKTDEEIKKNRKSQ